MYEAILKVPQKSLVQFYTVEPFAYHLLVNGDTGWIFMTAFENKLKNTDTAKNFKCLFLNKIIIKNKLIENYYIHVQRDLGSVGRRMNVILFKWRGNVKMEDGARTIKIVLGAALGFVS